MLCEKKSIVFVVLSAFLAHSVSPSIVERAFGGDRKGGIEKESHKEQTGPRASRRREAKGIMYRIRRKKKIKGK